MSANTVLLRLAGPMQSWGTASRLQLRRTDGYPSKSGVLGLLLCAMGIGRDASPEALAGVVPLTMALRVDRPGTAGWDYHTAGAGYGLRQAAGGVKENAKTKEPEVLVSRRQYLYDASFLVALRGEPDTVRRCAAALADPVWPVFLGRKCCVPGEPVLEGTGEYGSPGEALASLPWRPRVASVDWPAGARTITLETWTEHTAGGPVPESARLVHDLPRVLGYWSHAARWVLPGQVEVTVGQPLIPAVPAPARPDPYGPGWDGVRRERLKLDHGLCVFCKSPATEVHHLDYEDVRLETVRSLCTNCHDACTRLEYGRGMTRRRIDPADPAQRPEISAQLERLLREHRRLRRRELLEQGRAGAADFFAALPGGWGQGGG
jgi:CRISPR-associated protein Cas5/CasD subtype I-E